MYIFYLTPEGFIAREEISMYWKRFLLAVIYLRVITFSDKKCPHEIV